MKKNFDNSIISISSTNKENHLIYKSRPSASHRFIKNNSQINVKSPYNLGSSPSIKDLQKNDKTFSFVDKEKIEEEMKIIAREIKIKTKEYEIIKKEYNKIEEENAIIINLLDNLISECQEIEEPLEKKYKDINKEDDRTKLLINKYKNKFNLFKKELSNKEETLKQLKNNERAMRMFELDDKIKGTKKDLEQSRKEQEDFLNQINSLNLKTNRTNEKIKIIINQNNSLKHEKNEYLSKIIVLTKEKQNLDSRKTALEEKVSALEKNIDEYKKSIEKKENEINSLKNGENKYNELNSKNRDYEKEVNNQLKNISSLNEQINKKNRQIKEDEKMINTFKKRYYDLSQKENDLKNDEIKLQELKNKKQEKKNILDELKKLNEIILNYKFQRYKNSELNIEKIVSFSINVPISLQF